MTRSQIIERLVANRDRLREFSVAALFLFGSHARDEGRDDSDVDILVDFEADAHVGLVEFARLRRFLSELLRSDVDLVTRDALHRALREDILKELVRAT